MFTIHHLLSICDYSLYLCCLILLAGSIIISIKTRFIQIRLIPNLIKMALTLFSQKSHEGTHTIKPYKALFTAMSTTLGIGTIVGPVIAISLGGPGALLGFILVSFFGSATTFVEVSLCIQSRLKLPNGQIMGGPMQYLKNIFSEKAATWYAFCCFILMMAWSGAQANQLAAILDSPLLGDSRISPYLSGGIMAVAVFTLLLGGIKKIGSIEAKLIPLKFSLYVGACLFIIFSDFTRLKDVFPLIFTSFLEPYEMATGAMVGGVVNSLRWGIFRGTQICEAGVGSQTIPHSMAETNNAQEQGTIAMMSTIMAGLIAFLSGLVALITGTWQDPSLPLGMSMVAASFNMYFASFGIAGLAACAVIFAFGTILGNGYNGSQAFSYITQNKKLNLYYAATAISIFLGSILDAKTVWAMTDVILALMALPHMAALVVHVMKNPIYSSQKENQSQLTP